MNAVTALLLAILVQVGGVDLDRSGAVTVQRFEGSQLTASWRLRSREDGVYRFDGPEGSFVVERLRGSDLGYVVVDGAASGMFDTEAPEWITVVNLAAVADSLRYSPERPDRIHVPVAPIRQAWYVVPPEPPADEAVDRSEGMADSAAADEPPDRDGVPAAGEAQPTGEPPTMDARTVTVTVSEGQLTASEPAGGTVLTLHHQPRR